MHDHCEPAPAARTLHVIELPSRLCDTRGAALRRGLLVDRETTGLSLERDQVIEGEMLPFTCATDGCIANVLHHRARHYLQDPDRSLDAEITNRTGLTDDDLRSRQQMPANP